MSPRRWFVGAALLTSALAVACGGDADVESTSTTAPAAAQSATPAGDSSASQPSTTTLAPTRTATPVIDYSDPRRPLTDLEDQIARALSSRGWETDFGARIAPLDELMSGGPGRDGIPPIDEPKFVSQATADGFLDASEPVILLEVNGEARAYPIQVLIWHEIVNDTLGGVPVTVTFCPLCNTAITFDRRVDGDERTFGVSGLLRNSDLVMWDRTNQSLWQQITGEAIVGTDIGTVLTFLPSQIVSWAEFREAHPDADVLSRETGFTRRYGENPYSGYDRIGWLTYFPLNDSDGRLDTKERVLTVEIDGEAIAFPFELLTEQVVMEVELAGQPVVAFWQSGALSALDAQFIIGSRNVGSAGAFSPFIDGERVSFEQRDGQIVDVATGSVWSVLGRATSGELNGTALEPVVSGNHFWFSWSIFRPDTKIIKAPADG